MLCRQSIVNIYHVLNEYYVASDYQFLRCIIFRSYFSRLELIAFINISCYTILLYFIFILVLLYNKVNYYFIQIEHDFNKMCI